MIRWKLGALSLISALLLSGCGGGGAPDKIIRVSRQNNSGTYHYFREAVLGKNREFKLGSIDMSGSKDVVELVSTTPGAIGFSGMGYATPEVKMLSVSKVKGDDPVAPTSENATSGAYPLARPLFIYTLGEPTGSAKHYLNWILSSAGQEIVAENGYVPVETVEDALGEEPEPGRISIAGSDTMVNLAASWAERYTSTYSKVRPEVAGGGSGVGISKLIDGTLQMANASREMKPKEREDAEKNSGKKVKKFVVAQDALAVYVHKDNPLDSISLAELAEIYGEGGMTTKWTEIEGWPSQGP